MVQGHLLNHGAGVWLVHRVWPGPAWTPVIPQVACVCSGCKY